MLASRRIVQSDPNISQFRTCQLMPVGAIGFGNLANMRSLGLTKVDVYCAAATISYLPDDVRRAL
jgi:hypothetical protein